MKVEIDALKASETWSIINLPFKEDTYRLQNGCIN